MQRCWSGEVRKKYRIGVLCYGLTPATVDLLNRLVDRLDTKDLRLKAFPLVKKDISGLDIHFPYYPNQFTGRYWVIKGKVPDSWLLTVQPSTIFNLLIESDLIVLLGIQSIPAVISALLARLMHKPVLPINQTMPPAMERRRPWYIRWPKKLVLRMAQFHIVQSEASEQTLREVYGIRGDQLVYAPFDGGGRFFKKLLEQYPLTDRDEIRAQFCTSRNAVVFTFVGTLIYLKGVDVLLEAFAKMSPLTSNSYLWIVGPDGKKGGQLTALREQAQRLGILERTIFLGRKSMEELVAIYRASDVFVLPTRKDVWPKVLVEAALVGLPLITTPASGAAYTLVRDGVNGYVVPINDADALARAMLRLTDSQARIKMGERSREIVEEFIQPELEADRIVETIVHLLKSRH
ncbi:hypothetical protein DRN74_04800 [Candidatus Micrarchaeota archaeon]|nr:MAG: hypothetical protein DRN74_04800 [Candidatus Micrarchaeota archaeon]